MAFWRRNKALRPDRTAKAGFAAGDGPGTPSANSHDLGDATAEPAVVAAGPRLGEPSVSPLAAGTPVAPQKGPLDSVAEPVQVPSGPPREALPGSSELLATSPAPVPAPSPAVQPTSEPPPQTRPKGASAATSGNAPVLPTSAAAPPMTPAAAPGGRPPRPTGQHVPRAEPDDGQLAAAPPAPRPGPARLLPRVIAVANQKGGVGKTTTTGNLGASLALFGYRVLIVDLDPQGNATTGLGVDARGFQHSMYDVLLNDTPMVDCIEPVGIENLFVAPATLALAGVEQELFSALSRELRLQRALATVIDDYDFIFVACPPPLGLITINAFAAAKEILVPVQCEFYALEGLTQLQRIVELVQRNLNEQLEISTVVLTMYDARTRLSEDVANEVRRHFPTQTQGTVIPRTVRLSEAPSFGQPITTFDPASKGARAYKALAREVSDGAQKRAG